MMRDVDIPPGAHSLKSVVRDRMVLDSKVLELTEALATGPRSLAELERQKYQTSIRELHIWEIYRLAALHFPRLRKEHSITPLTDADVAEIEKWIGRAKSTESLAGIVLAFKELEKYKLSDIRKNLYALVQRIIIGGAYNEKGS